MHKMGGAKYSANNMAQTGININKAYNELNCLKNKALYKAPTNLAQRN